MSQITYSSLLHDVSVTFLHSHGDEVATNMSFNLRHTAGTLCAGSAQLRRLHV